MNPHAGRHWCSCHVVLDTFLLLLSFLQCQFIVHILGSSLANEFLIIKCNCIKFVIVYLHHCGWVPIHGLELGVPCITWNLRLSIQNCFSSYSFSACLPVHPSICLPAYQNSTVCNFNILNILMYFTTPVCHLLLPCSLSQSSYLVQDKLLLASLTILFPYQIVTSGYDGWLVLTFV